MNQEQKYQQYLSTGGEATFDEYKSVSALFSPEEMDDLIGVKKKEDTQPTVESSSTDGSVTNTNESNPTEPILPPMPDPIPAEEFSVPIGSEQELVRQFQKENPSLGLGSMEQSTSTVLPSTGMVSSGVENSNIILPNTASPELDNVGNIPADQIRNDGSLKGKGFLGTLKGKGGKDVTEFSIGVEINGKEIDIPTIIPTLTQEELDYVLGEGDMAIGIPIADRIATKAQKFAEERISKGLPAFATPEEEGKFAIQQNPSNFSQTKTPPNLARISKERKISFDINTEVNNESLITEDGEKAFTNINGFNIPKELLPDPNDDKAIIYDRDGNFNPWIKADKINLEDLKPAPFNSYTSSVTDNIEEDNANILEQSKLGNVEIKTENGAVAKDKDGKLVYKFIDKEYYDKEYVPYIGKANVERRKKEEDTNLDATYANRIISEKPNSELDDLYDDFEQVFGRKPTDEERLSVYNPESLLNFRANIEVERLKKLDPNADENVLRQQALNKFSAYTPSDIQTGSNVLNLINESFQRDASNENYDVPTLFKDNNNGQFRSNDADEFNQWNSISKNQSELGSFGKYWKEEGEAEFGSSWVKQRQITYQEKRLEIMGAYLDWKNRDLRILDEAKTNLIKQSKWETKQAAESGDGERTQITAGATIALLNDYGQFVNNLKAQENNDINTFSKFKREQDKFRDQVGAKTDFINGQDKPAQYAANLVLGFASSIQTAVTGVARLASLPFGEGNFSDAVDVMGKPLTVGKYGSAPLSLNIKRYEGGIDDGGNKFEYREVNGDQYSYSNGKYTKLFGKIPEKAKFIDTETEYTAAGFLFQGSKMATDIILTQGMGNAINKGIGAVSTKVFKFSRTNALANTKNLAQVFGNESLLARGSASMYKASRNINNASVTGWTVQMTEDAYQDGKRGGLKGGNLVAYTVFNAGLQSLIQRINPDVKFLKSIKTDHYNLMNALLSSNKDKALLYFNNIKGKVLNNATGETVEETTQQVVQDFTNLFTNSLTGSDLQFGTMNDYRDILVSTPILSGALGASMGRNGKATVNIGGRNVDVSSLTTAELETEVARNKGAEKFIKDYINTAYFDSVKERATDILNNIETRSKYVNKIPNQKQYSTNTITQASILLQQKEKLEKELSNTDDSMKFLVEGELESTKTKIRELFDNTEINTNFNAETETAQATPQPEAVQTEANGTKTTIDLNAKTGDELYQTESTDNNLNQQDGSAPVQIESPNAEIKEDGQGSQEGRSIATDQLTEMGEGNQESEQVAAEIASQEEVKPIGQLGNGANIYFETPKTRLNDNQFGTEPYILNIGDKDNAFPRANIEFSDLNEARFVAERVDKDFPNGMPDAIDVDKYINQVKKEFNEKEKNSQQIPAESSEQFDDSSAETSATGSQENINSQDSENEISEEELQQRNIAALQDILDQQNTEANIDDNEEDTLEEQTRQDKIDFNNSNFDKSKKSFELFENENSWKPAQSTYKLRNPANFVSNFLDNKAKREFNKLRDENEKYFETKEEAEIALNKLLEFESRNQTAFDKAKDLIDSISQDVKPAEVSDKKETKQTPTETKSTILTKEEQGRNTLVGMKNDYNKLSAGKKNQTKGKEAFARINQLAKDLGYPVGSLGDGKISIKNPKTGKEMAKVKEVLSEKIPTPQEVESAKQYLGDVATWDGNAFNDHWESDLTWAEIRKGNQDIENGKLNTVPARRLVNEINRQLNDYGGFNFTKGSGAQTEKTFISLQEIAQYKQDFPRVWNNLDLLTDQELENLYNERLESEKEFYTNGPSQSENNSVYEERQDIPSKSSGNDQSQAELKVKRYFDSYSSLPFGQTGDLDSDGRTSTETGRKIRWGAELSDGSIVSYDGVIRITKPELWNKIKDGFKAKRGKEKNKFLIEKTFTEKDFKQYLNDIYNIVVSSGNTIEDISSNVAKRDGLLSGSLIDGLFGVKLNVDGKTILPSKYLIDKEYGLLSDEDAKLGNELDSKKQDTNSPEYKSLISQRNDQEARVKTAKSKLDAVSKTTNKDFQGDQEDLFGERPATQGMFDERADGNAGKELIATAKREYDQAKAELSRLNNAVRDFESGKVTGTESINFQIADEKNMVALHNISEDKLERSLNKGGLPVPSIAIIKKGMNFGSFGEITLIGNTELGNPQSNKNKIFGADIYSPKYPTVETTFKSITEQRKFEGEILNATDQYLKRGYIDFDNLFRGFGDSNTELFYMIEKGIPFDETKARSSVSDYFNTNPNAYSEFKNWFNDKLSDYDIQEKIFDGYTASGNRRYLPHNLDNVVKIMTRKTRDGEGYNYGSGNIRASVTPQFKTVKQLKANADKLVSAEEFSKIKDEVNQDLENVADAVAKGFKFDTTSFGYLDTVSEMLKDYAKNKSKAKRDYFNELSVENEKIIEDYLTKLKNLPTEYFEGKPQRIVDVREFSAAIVPKNTSPELIKRLETRGIKVYKYESSKERAGIIEQAATENDLYFQKTDEKFAEITPEVAKSLIERLKKPFAKAFSNLNVTTDLDAAKKRAKELGKDITDLELRNQNGNVYGFKLPDGTIYINPNKLNANTPIHEFSHLWEQIMPNAWKKGLAIFKETSTGKKMFAQLQKEGNYSQLTEDQVWIEAMNTLIGNLGEQQYQRKPKGKMAEFIDWFKNAMSRFINTVTGKKELNKELDLNAFTDKVLVDLLGEKELVPESASSQQGDIQYSKNDLKDGAKKLIRDLVDLVKGKPGNSAEKRIFGKVTPEGAQYLSDLLGVNISDDFTHTIDRSSINHAHKNHGDIKIEESRGQIALTNEDYELAADIISTPDQVINTGKNEKGLQTVTYIKKFEDGTIVYIEEVRTGKKELALNSIRKMKGNIGIQQRYNDANKASNIPTPETTAASKNSLSTTNIPNLIDFATDDVKNVLNEGNIDFNIVSQNKNIPAKTLSSIVTDIQQNGTESGFEKLQNSDWYQNLSEDQQSEFNAGNYVQQLLSTSAAQVKSVEDKNEKLSDKIEKIKEKYAQKIAEVKANSAKTSRERIAKVRNIQKQAYNDLVDVVTNDKIKRPLTPTETSRLIKSAAAILNTTNTTKALDNFVNLYNKINTSENEKQANNDAKRVEKISTAVNEAFSNGQKLADIYNDNPSLFKFDNSKEIARRIFERLESQTKPDANAFEKSLDRSKQLNDAIGRKPSFKEAQKAVRRRIIKEVSDRQFLPKFLMKSIGAQQTYNRMVAVGGASASAKNMYQKVHDKVFAKLTNQDSAHLNEMIKLKRVIAIDESREGRKLDPIDHEGGLNKFDAQAALNQLREKIGDKKFSELEKNSKAYFDAFKDILKQMKEAGMINQGQYDSMAEIDYQPRQVASHFFDMEFDKDGKLTKVTPITGENISDSFPGLNKDQIKSLQEGSIGLIMNNAESLLSNAILGRSKAIFMNRVNKTFITRDFPAAKLRYEELKGKDAKDLNSEDKRFVKYFEELGTMIKENPMIDISPSGKPVFMFKDLPSANWKRAFYFENGIRKEFFMRNDLYEDWHDTMKKLDGTAKDIISTISGSSVTKLMATGRNPGFALVNTPRDFGALVLLSEEYNNVSAIATIQVAKDAIKGIREIYRYNNTQKDNILEKYLRYGGGMNFLNTEGETPTVLKYYEKIFGKNSTNNKTKTIVGNVFDYATLKSVSNYSELMFRVGTFDRAVNNRLKKLGVNKITELDAQTQEDIYIEAVERARKVLDFNQGGRTVKSLEAVMPYLNAATQGSRVLADSMTNRPVATTFRLLQGAGMLVSMGVATTLLAISSFGDDDDEDKRSSIEKYLDIKDGLSRFQKRGYVHFFTGKKNEEGQYTSHKMAITQPLTPIYSFVDNITDDILRTIVGRKPNGIGVAIDEAQEAFSANVDPIGVTDITKLGTKNPIVKSLVTYQSGYDFFRDQNLDGSINKVPKRVEGYENKKVEDFYKKFGLEAGFSPVRTKAAVEAIMTSPDTNPFLSMMYGGVDAAVGYDSGFNEEKGFAKTFIGSFEKRISAQTSDYSRFNNSLSDDARKRVEDKAVDDYLIDTIVTSAIKSNPDPNAEWLNKTIQTVMKNNSLTKQKQAYLVEKLTTKFIDLKTKGGGDPAIGFIKYETFGKSQAKAQAIVEIYGKDFPKNKEVMKKLVLNNLLSDEVIINLDAYGIKFGNLKEQINEME